MIVFVVFVFFRFCIFISYKKVTFLEEKAAGDNYKNHTKGFPDFRRDVGPQFNLFDIRLTFVGDFDGSFCGKLNKFWD